LRIVAVAVTPAIVDADVLPDGPPQLLQALRERCQAGFSLCIVRFERGEHADPAHPRWLLCVRCERPRRRRTTQNTEKFPPPHVRP
jgi:hypothetical protein